MALTRKFLKALGIEDDKIDQIIEEHTTIANRMNDEIEKYKPDAERLKAVQKELDDLKAKGDGGYKEKYEKEHRAFEDYKADITTKETKAAKEKAVRAYFESKNITGANLELAMRGCGEEMAALELENGKLKDTQSLDALVNGTYKGLISTTTVVGSGSANPPANTGRAGGAGYGDIYKKDDKGRYVMSTAERQRAIAEKMANENE